MLPAGEFEYAAQLKHVEAVLAPTAAEYVPSPQFVHTTLPPLGLYLPATHAPQTPPFTPVYPALQEQLPMTELDAAEFEFAGHAPHVDVLAPTTAEKVPATQSVHGILPALVLYLPETQATQGPPSGPVLPAAHAGNMHPFTDDVPPIEFVPPGQLTHVDGALAPTAVE